MKKKSMYIFIALAVMLLSVNLTALAMIAGNNSPVVIGRVPDASETVTAFFDAMKAGDYEAAMEYTDDYESLGFEKEGSELIELYKQTLIESYNITLTDSAQQESRLEAVQGVDFTFLDCRLLTGAVSEKTAAAAMEYMNDGNVIENDEQAMEFVYDAFRECLAAPEQFYTTEHFEIGLTYDGESWRMDISDSLADAMFGYINSLSAEGIN